MGIIRNVEKKFKWKYYFDGFLEIFYVIFFLLLKEYLL